MRHYLSLLLLTLSLGAGWAQAVPYYRTSHALLIGINQYQGEAALTYAVADVKAVREVLVNLYGFPGGNVTLLTDGQATRGAITDALNEITSEARVAKEDRVLIYFSGHGQTVQMPTGGQKGFLIPVDARVPASGTDAAPYMKTCIAMDQVWTALDLCPAKHVLLIADACYSGLLAKTRDLQAAPDVSARVLAARPARQVLTAGRAGEKALEKSEWGHGAFTYKFLAELTARAAEPGSVVTAKELYATIARSVVNLTGGRQTPVLADKDTDGEFLFIVPGTAVAPGGVTPTTVPLPDVEGTIIEKARQTLTKAGFKIEERSGDDPGQPHGLVLTTTPAPGTLLPPGSRISVVVNKRLTTPVTPPSPVSPKRGDTRINPQDGAVMVFIPAGAFPMGSAEGEVDERPVHQVYLDDYYIYKTPVTVAQYRKFCTATGQEMPKAPSWGWQDTHPVVNVTWHDAQAYAAWARVRLPTEAQWEKAARGDDGRTYPWGATWDAAKCNSSESNRKQTTPVGSFPAGASPYGVLDMAGNVWNWCADWYDGAYYQTSPARNPTGPTTGTYRVLRGGSWNNDEYYTRSANRDGGSNPDDSWFISGFRCVSLSPGP
jgi:formylglycine-generating enzyme required for sulfatase activity